MRSLRSISALALLASLALIACKKSPELLPDSVATVGTRQIKLDDFKRYLQRNAGTELAQTAPPAASALLDQFLEEVLLSEYSAQKGNEPAAEEVASALRADAGSTVAEKRDDLRRARLINGLAANVSEPTAAQVEEYYRTNPDEFRSGDRVHARQILVRNAAAADEVLAALKRGEPFSELARKHSVAPNAAHGGDVGFVGRGQLPQIFENVIFSLEAGQHSDVVATDGSFHIFTVEELRPAGVVLLPEAEPVIRERLRDDSVREAVRKTLVEARKTIPVVVHHERLTFAYSGAFPKADAE